MTMATREYELLKEQLDEIIALAGRFPESVRERVYRALVETEISSQVHHQTTCGRSGQCEC